jgi:hypothetical protein
MVLAGQRCDGGEDPLGLDPDAQVIRLERPTYRPALVDENLCRERDIVAVMPIAMADVQSVEHLTLGIGKKREVTSQTLSQCFRRVRLIDADGEQLYTLPFDLFVVLCELPELSTAEGSPIATIEDVQGRALALELGG